MALHTTGPISHSQIMGEFGHTGTFNLSADGADLIGKTANSIIKESDFYGAKAGPTGVTSWDYNSADYFIDTVSFKASPYTFDPLNVSSCPWNTTGDAYDKTDATKAPKSHLSALSAQVYSTEGGNPQNSASGTGFYSPSNSQYPNDGHWSWCRALYPFQLIKAGNYTISCTATAWPEDGRSHEIYGYLYFFSTWSISGGIGKVSGGHPGGRVKVFEKTRRIPDNEPLSANFTVPAGYEYVCFECYCRNTEYRVARGANLLNIKVRPR